MKRLLYALLSVLVVAGLALVLWPRGGATAKPMTIAFSQEPDNVVSEYSTMSFATWLDQVVMAGLGKWDDKNNFIPDLAEEIPTAANGDITDEGKTIKWKLKAGLKWSDGEPLTSKDVLFTWQSQKDKGNAPISREGYNKIDSIETPDDTTAIIHFTTLYPPWPTLFTLGPNTAGPILPQHILAGKTGLEKNPEIHQPTVCAGPFKIKEWVAGFHMILVANPNYYKGAPKLAEIDIKFVPNPEAALAALQTGDVHFVPDFAESDIPTLQALEREGKLRVRIDKGPEFEHLFFNLGVTTGAGAGGTGASDVAGFGPFQDVNVRKAIMLGIDREKIVKNLLHGQTTVPASLWPNSSWENKSLTPYPYDPVEARKLLETAGYPVGADGIRAGMYGGKPVKFSLDLETTDKQLRKEVVLVIQDDLKKIGIEIRPNHLPGDTLFESYSAGGSLPLGKFDMAIFMTGFFPDPDPGDYFLSSGVPNKTNPSGQNSYHYCNPEMDKLFAAGLASADPAIRKKAYDAIQKFQYDNVLFIPLYARAEVYGFSNRFVFPPTSALSGWAGDAYDFELK